MTRKITLTESEIHNVIRQCVNRIINEWSDVPQAQLSKKTSSMLGDFSPQYSDADDKNQQAYQQDYQKGNGGFNNKRSSRDRQAYFSNEDPLAMRQRAYNMVGKNKQNPELAKHIMRNTSGNTPYTVSKGSNAAPINKNFDTNRMQKMGTARSQYKFSKPFWKQ